MYIYIYTWFYIDIHTCQWGGEYCPTESNMNFLHRSRCAPIFAVSAGFSKLARASTKHLRTQQECDS